MLCASLPFSTALELIRMFARLERQRARHLEMLDVVMCRIRLRKDGSDAHVLDPRSVFLELKDQPSPMLQSFPEPPAPTSGFAIRRSVAPPLAAVSPKLVDPSSRTRARRHRQRCAP